MEARTPATFAALVRMRKSSRYVIVMDTTNDYFGIFVPWYTFVSVMDRQTIARSPCFLSGLSLCLSLHFHGYSSSPNVAIVALHAALWGLGTLLVHSVAI